MSDTYSPAGQQTRRDWQVFPSGAYYDGFVYCFIAAPNCAGWWSSGAC